MRVHLHIEAELIARVDEIAGPRGRSEFVRNAVRAALERQQRWERLERAAGALGETPQEWDADPAEWVRQQRRAAPGRSG